MESVVGKLLDVDREARMMIDDARQYYDRTIEEIAGEKNRIREDYEKRAAKHLDDIQTAETISANESSAEVRERYARLTSAIDAAYEQNHSQWENELYARCVGRNETA